MGATLYKGVYAPDAGAPPVIPDEADVDKIWNHHGYSLFAWKQALGTKFAELPIAKMLDLLTSKNVLDKTVGGQTKMLLGLNISDSVSNQKFVARYKGLQKHIDRNFKFVGIFEDWEASIRLFHTMFNLGPVLSVELKNPRKATGHNFDYSTWPEPIDPYDSNTYQLVQKKFAKLAVAHDLTGYITSFDILP